MKIKHPRAHTLAHTHIHKNTLSVAGRNIVMFELIFRKVGRVCRDKLLDRRYKSIMLSGSIDEREILLYTIYY